MNFKPGDCVLIHTPDQDTHGATGIVLRVDSLVHVYLHGKSTRVLQAFPFPKETLIKMSWVPA